ncbi:MAG: hypothetical protein IH881_13950 [Myxococcales bacterium]|nr:hypothetical protein [Myxococcales bacterium]
MLKRVAFAAMMLGILCAGSAQARNYSLIGGGAQLHVGQGLALPIQAAVAQTGAAFPPLLITAQPVNVVGTTAMAFQQKVTVPAAAMKRVATQQTVGVFASNPAVYAVGTNLNYTWPTAAAVFSTGARTGATTTTFTALTSQSITYSNSLNSKFGGPAQFALSPNAVTSGLSPLAAVTIYAAVGVPPPCTHTVYDPGMTAPFPSAGCVAAILYALPTGVGGPGRAATLASVLTPGGTPAAVAIGALIPGAGPALLNAAGTPAVFNFGPALTPEGGFNAAPLNAATSKGFPWTTGKIIIKAPGALGGPETFTLTGGNTFTGGGQRTIQMVSGALSIRSFTGQNANRGWVRLILLPVGSGSAMGPIGIAMAATLMGYLLYRRQGARTAA